MNTKEQTELCSNALVNLFFEEKFGQKESYHDPEITNLFPVNIVLQKLERCGIDVFIPDMILMVFDICCLGNPGIIQLMTKELLMDIKSNQGGSIPKGYIVTAEDFINLHGDAFPIIAEENLATDISGATDEKPVIDSTYNQKYHKLWLEQKREQENPFESDNLCDTTEWWQEVL